MTDRVHPAAKPAAAAAASGGANNPTFPATKPQLYNPNRPAYRPLPPRRRHRRSCCCSVCLWTTLLIILALLLAAAAAAVLYVVYNPQPPSFSVASLQLARFNLTDTAVTSAFNVTLIARNRNGAVAFLYDQTAVRILSGGVDIGDGSFLAFAHGERNVTTLRSTIASSNSPIDAGADMTALKSSVRSRNLPLEIQLDTKVRVKIGGMETKKVEIRVTCQGIRIAIPTGKTASLATTSNAKCEVDPRIKILRWTV